MAYGPFCEHIWPTIPYSSLLGQMHLLNNRKEEALQRYYSPMTITTFTETRNKMMKSFILCSNIAVVSQLKSKTRPIRNTSKLKMLILTLFRFYAECIILNVQFQVFKNVAAAFEYTQICLNKILICQGKVKLNKQLVFSYVKFRQKLEEFLSLKKYIKNFFSCCSFSAFSNSVYRFIAS